MAFKSLAELAAADFAPLAGETFTVEWPEGTEQLVLDEVNEGVPAAGGGFRSQFSLVFRGVTPGLLLNQQIHPLRNPVTGLLNIFLVPIAQSPEGIHLYQACFS